MKHTIIYFLTFMLMQVLFGMAVPATVEATGLNLTMSQTLLISTGLSGLATALLAMALKWFRPSRDYVRSRPWAVLIWSMVLAVGMVLPLTWLEELIPASLRPDVVGADMLADMLRSEVGYFVICMLAPLVEEIIFRGAMIPALTKWQEERRQRLFDEGNQDKAAGISDNRIMWTAVILSAVLFSAAHFNPAQLPHTLLVGLLLGWLYARTGSILPCFLIHWINNSMAYVMLNMFPHLPADAPLPAYFPDDMTMYKAIGFSLLIALPALYQLVVRLKK